MRLAGRADEKKLIAPRWKYNPGAIAQKIETEMREAGFHQGDLCQHPNGQDLGYGD
jgi:radical SAM superfamily enzyme